MAGNGTTEQAAQYVLDRLKTGRAAMLTIESGRHRLRRIVLVPSPLFSSDHGYELLIVLEGGGSLFYTGQRPLNRFMLVAAGFPIDTAAEVAELVMTLFRLRHRAEVGAQAQKALSERT